MPAMSDTQVRIGRREDGQRRVGRVTAWVAAASAVLAALFGVVFATSAAGAQSSDSESSTSAGSGDSSGDTLQAPDSVPQQGAGGAHVGSGGS